MSVRSVILKHSGPESFTAFGEFADGSAVTLVVAILNHLQSSSEIDLWLSCAVVHF